MRRSLLAAIAAFALVLSALSVAAVWSLANSTGLLTRPAVGGMMSPAPGTGQGQGPGPWRHGPPVATEAEYLTEMVAHHQEAVDAAAQLQRSTRPQMRGFGAAIVRTQSTQIEQMNRWLDRWYPGHSPSAEYQPMMRGLAGLSGDALDRTFLLDMVGHHMAAVMMSQQLLARGTAEHAEVGALAQTIRDEQHTEILQMQRWLQNWFGVAWGHRSGWGTGSG